MRYLLAIVFINLFIASTASAITVCTYDRDGFGSVEVEVNSDKDSVEVDFYSKKRKYLHTSSLDFEDFYEGEVIDSSRDYTNGKGDSLVYRKVKVNEKIKYEIYFMYFGRSRKFTALLKVSHKEFLKADGEEFYMYTRCKDH